jgi:hypothetical protein
MAIFLVSGFSSYAFYLGTIWGRYTVDPRQRDNADKAVASWERTPRRPPAAGSDFDLP